MGRKCIGIYGKEREYAGKLAGYIRRRCGDELEVRVFTKKEILKECLESDQLDCVLVEKDAWGLCRNYGNVWMAILSEGEAGQSVYDIPCIEKYQSAEQIWKQLLKLGGERLTGNGGLAAENSETVFLGVASAVHGCGKTALGLCLSRFLAKQGRTLFLTLDEFSCLPEILGEEGAEAEVSELYYYYSQKELTRARIQSAVCRWGEAEYLAPAGGLGDLYREGKPYETDFFRCIAETGAYRYVVIDMGNSLFQKEKLLGMCRKLYVPEGKTEENAIRVDQFLKWMEYEGLLERLVRCNVTWKGEGGRQYSFRRAHLLETGAVARSLLQKDGFLSDGAGDFIYEEKGYADRTGRKYEKAAVSPSGT
ncbi:MAG: hypothetical protein HFI68_11730 [Lachnospiraceae bacterium]|nr:hypothetical protein [Lachnospiraceae bacterium]